MARLFQFRAGRCERRGQTNLVDPLPSKGLLYVEHNPDDGDLHHLCYKDLESGAVIDDFILFAGDASFKKVLVPDSSTARVYALCFSSSNQKVLYWMQDPDPTTDVAHVTRLNQLIDDDDQMPVEWSAENRPAPQVTEGSAPTQTRPTQPTDNQMNQLRTIIDGFSAANSSAVRLPEFRLVDVLTPESIEPLLDDYELLEGLSSYLPSGLKPDKQSVQKVVRSADFRAAVTSLDQALGANGGAGDDGLRMFLVHGLGLEGEWGMGVDGYLEAVMGKKGGPKK